MDPIELEVFQNVFSSIAEEMGVTLQRTGFSPNIKERRDYSCAVFDQKAQMIAQAAHIPVHLGAMPLSTQAAIDDVSMKANDAVILNDPFRGGTHLPDITLVSPVFLPGETQARFYVANRAHHADIGGKTPGSMPLSRHIDEEGIRISPRHFIREGQIDQSFLQEFLQNVRTPKEREGDLAAQMASNHIGVKRLQEIALRYGAEKLSQAANALCDYAERMTRHAIAQIPKGQYRFTDYLDDDGAGNKSIPLSVCLTLKEDETCTVDFTGSAPQVSGCINAVYAITASACHYVFRALVDFAIPANSGVSRPLTLIAPEGSIVNARFPAAVAGGNVETSQRIVDVLLGALAKALPEKIPAASSGSMNNLTLGGNSDTGPFAYYETVAGGAGAGPDWHGASAVHTHMTNTLNTPIEALEHSYPIRVKHYRVRKNSGGRGVFHGGDGVERAFTLLCDATVTLITERRNHSPWGLQGGAPGTPGENALQRANSSHEEEPLDAKISLPLKKGDTIIQKTPGGGGFGTP